ncbi:MAG: FIST N-terminal domain-containing protein [Acidimicrobiales bacterium]
MPFAAALSEHPVGSEAVGEVVGAVLERLAGGVGVGGEGGVDLAALFVTTPHAAAFDGIASAVRTLLAPRVLIGATSVSVIGGAREVEETPAVSLFAATGLGGLTPVRVEARAGGELGFSGIPDALAEDAEALILLPDPYTFPADAFLEAWRARHPQVAVIGGLASALVGPGGNRLVLDGEGFGHGAVGVVLGAGARIATIVSQGCRPVGSPYVVTRAEGNIIYELGGRPALTRLAELAAALAPAERELLADGVHVGRVIDERQLDFARGDFLIRGVLGADRDTGAVAVGDAIEVGATVQFQVRDAASADADLRELLAGRRAGGALVFTCNGRGRRLFAEPDHDALVVTEALGTTAAAGMFCAGELGPVGGRPFLHAFTASVALFDDAPAPGAGA